MTTKTDKWVLLDGSRVIIDSLVTSGADAFIAYPITPANLLYAYASERFPVFQAAPDEITALQWVTGFNAAGKLAVTATSFPGYALMIETVNMAYMMEIPMVIVLAQRLGPSTGSATAGAQGDILMMRSSISGGYPLPVFCPSDLMDCWEITHQSLSFAVKLRTPVILLTSKEMIMTGQSYNLSRFPHLTPVTMDMYKDSEPYRPYLAGDNMVPQFLPLGNESHQVRINASTHDQDGFIKKATPEALGNTMRLKEKIEKRIDEFTFFSLDEEEGSDTLIVTYGITANAARDAVATIRSEGGNVSLLVIKTLLPVPAKIMNILNKYGNIVFVEENVSGLMHEIIYGQVKNNKIRKVNKIGQMISPSEIVKEVKVCKEV